MCIRRQHPALFPFLLNLCQAALQRQGLIASMSQKRKAYESTFKESLYSLLKKILCIGPSVKHMLRQEPPSLIRLKASRTDTASIDHLASFHGLTLKTITTKQPFGFVWVFFRAMSMGFLQDVEERLILPRLRLIIAWFACIGVQVERSDDLSGVARPESFENSKKDGILEKSTICFLQTDAVLASDGHRFPLSTELFQLLVKTIPLLCRSKKEVLLFFQGAGVRKEILEVLESLLTTNRDAFRKHHVTREDLIALNEEGDKTLREPREVIRRVASFVDFSVC